MKKWRIDNYISKSLGISRKDAKKVVLKGRVKLNGKVMRDPKLRVSEDDEVFLDDELLSPPKEYVYIILNKPAGFVSSTKDVEAIVLDLIEHPRVKELFPVGRLDKNAVGLLILTNDGKLAHKLTSPKYGVEREYVVVVNCCADKLKVFTQGIYDSDDFLIAKEVRIIDDKKAHIVLTEGKHHEIKRMVRFVGLHLVELKRIRYGPIILDNTLKEGQWRELSEDEIKKLKSCVGIK